MRTKHVLADDLVLPKKFCDIDAEDLFFTLERLIKDPNRNIAKQAAALRRKHGVAFIAFLMVVGPPMLPVISQRALEKAFARTYLGSFGDWETLRRYVIESTIRPLEVAAEDEAWSKEVLDFRIVKALQHIDSHLHCVIAQGVIFAFDKVYPYWPDDTMDCDHADNEQKN